MVFDTKETKFSILNVLHQTTPPYEFGKIDELEVKPKSRRYKYELLNPGDEDVMTLLTNTTSGLGLYAKAEGLKLIQREVKEAKGKRVGTFIGIIATIVSVGSAVLTQILVSLRSRRSKTQRLR